MAFTQFSPSDKQCALADFKRVADERCPGHVNGFSNEAPVNDPVLEDESDPTRKEFFASGAENWLSVLEDLTFPSVSLPLSMDMATAFAQGKLSAQQHNALAHAIDDTLAEKGWPQVFVKLSTRSPKDAPQILQKASATFIDRGGLSLAANERCALFSDLVQENFSVSSGNEAVDLLLASERIHEDCAYATEAQNYDELGVHIVLRRWDGAIPSSNEFRGIVWQGKMNAVSQYYHPLYFPQLEGFRATIVQDLSFVFDKIEPKLREAGFSNYIIDFAWLGPDKVRVIEVNPFDGVSLGTMAASTCLFSWENPEDRRIITDGPFEFRLRNSSQSEYDLKRKMNPEWRDIAFPPRWKCGSASNHGEKGAYPKAFPKNLPKSAGKGKGICLQ